MYRNIDWYDALDVSLPTCQIRTVPPRPSGGVLTVLPFFSLEKLEIAVRLHRLLVVPCAQRLFYSTVAAADRSN